MTFRKPAAPAHPIHELIRERWSPRSFDPTRELEESTLRALFEAARWAPSAMNDQPWHFLVATRREAPEFAAALACLYEKNQRWAQDASALVFALTRPRFAASGDDNPHAWYDVGQAVAFLTLEAQARGISLHQIGGFDSTRVHEAFGVPLDHQPVVALALGYTAPAERLEEPLRARELAPRSRRAQNEFVFSARWAKARE